MALLRKTSLDIRVDGRDAAAIIAGFQQLNWAMQKKYLGQAIKMTAESKISSLKNASPKNKGALKNSVGAIVNKPRRKPAKTQLKGSSVVGRLGFRRGQTAKGKARGGNTSHWVESGTGKRAPKRSKAFAIEWRYNRKYQYLKPLRAKKATHIFLLETRPVKGQGFFGKWLRKNRRSLMAKLKAELGANLKLAIAEGQRKAQARALKKASKQLAVLQ